MSESKHRGTYEQRVEQAKERLQYYEDHKEDLDNSIAKDEAEEQKLLRELIEYHIKTSKLWNGYEK